MKRRDPWAAVEEAYMDRDEGTIKDLARKHGVPYAALLRRMKVEGWEVKRELVLVRWRLEQETKALAFSRKQAVLQARHMIEVCRDASLDLRTLHYEAKEAQRGAMYGVHSHAARLAEAQADLRELEAGRMPPAGGSALFPNDPRWDRPGSWYAWEDVVSRPGRPPRYGQRPGKPGQGAERGQAISARRYERAAAKRS